MTTTAAHPRSAGARHDPGLDHVHADVRRFPGATPADVREPLA
ncbi:hypothetical protein ACGFNQ_17990 [Streptomyces asoensis]|nr:MULTISPECIES: hypothetical protein [unclassified Streptomyces]